VNELLDKVNAIIKEHGLLTGQEFLDLTSNDMPLYHAYLSYWDALVVPDLESAIERKIKGLGG
jgi:hypothetical protein